MQSARAESADRMDPAVRYQEILRRLAIVDEKFVGDQAGLVLDRPGVRSGGSRARLTITTGELCDRVPRVCCAGKVRPVRQRSWSMKV
jgi:hypothetical protein